MPPVPLTACNSKGAPQGRGGEGFRLSMLFASFGPTVNRFGPDAIHHSLLIQNAVRFGSSTDP